MKETEKQQQHHFKRYRSLITITLAQLMFSTKKITIHSSIAAKEIIILKFSHFMSESIHNTHAHNILCFYATINHFPYLFRYSFFCFW